MNSSNGGESFDPMAWERENQQESHQLFYPSISVQNRGRALFQISTMRVRLVVDTIFHHCRQKRIIFNQREKSRRTTGGLINDAYNSWGDIPQETFQNAIAGCRKIYQACYNNRGDMIMWKHDLFLRKWHIFWKVNVPMVLHLQKFLTCPKLSLPQKSASSLANRKIKKNCRRDVIESALEPPDNVLSNAFWFRSIRQKEKILSQFFQAWYLNYYLPW